MRTTQSATQKKQQQFRLQIRRRQIQKLLSVHRHQLGTLTPPAAINLCRNNLRQLHQIIQQQPNTALYGHHRLHILLKQLRDISCNCLAQQIFALRDNIHTVLQLQNRNKWLDNSSTVFLHQVILNISADPATDSQGMKISPITIQSLNIKQNLQSNNPQLLKLTIKILTNILQLDPTSKTIYYLITKVQIYKLLLILLIDRQEIYHIHKLQNIVIWFCSKIINKVIRYKFQYVDKDWGNFVKFVFAQLQAIFQIKYSQNQQQNIIENYQMEELENVITINDMLIYFKTLIKTTVIQLTDQLIHKLQHYFCPSNMNYIDYLNTLTYTTMYSLPLSHLQSLLTFLLSHPTFQHSSKIMRCISNSLINNGQHYKTVLNTFIQYSQQKPLNYILNIQDNNNNYSQYGLLMYFMYYLNNSECQYDMVQIIGVIISSQGGLGIFQEGLQYLMESNLFNNKICSYGFQIQEQM